MKKAVFIRVLFAISIAAYPFIVYFGIQVLSPSFFGLLLAMVMTLRFGVLLPQERRLLLPLLAILLAYSLLAAFLSSMRLLLWYPALVNFLLCGIFANSLRFEEPLLLRLVKARNMVLSEHAPRYLRTLTGLWAVFFALNGTMALWTSSKSLELWTLYNGLISYFIVAALMGGEWIFRRWYKKRMSTTAQ